MGSEYRIDIYLNGGSGGGSKPGLSDGLGTVAGAAGSGLLGKYKDGIIHEFADDGITGYGVKTDTNVSNKFFGALGNIRTQSKALGLLNQNITDLKAGMYHESQKDIDGMIGANNTAIDVTHNALAANMRTAMVPVKYSIIRTGAYVSNHVGLWTGDNTNQQKINNAMKLGIAGYAVATGNPVLAGIGLGLEAGFHAIDYSYKRAWDGKQEQESARRSGLVRYINRNNKG